VRTGVEVGDPGVAAGVRLALAEHLKTQVLDVGAVASETLSPLSASREIRACSVRGPSPAAVPSDRREDPQRPGPVRPLLEAGAEIRLHGTVLYNSMYPADDGRSGLSRRFSTGPGAQVATGI
jgi:hypothetical protein